ncbi:MAG TPA: tRNA (adenosine(37)-N6)-threonylcarbamoyltransferase complex dimerization subunit type 1 TsaB [Legionellales bacterium]|nr:tRNA (adenosine(37)-N6)-threonylcarbamoyltransferase complex dimerization subunit type 1 TsaB [Legionellales bacterium]
MVWLAIDTASDKASYALKVGDKLYTREKDGVTSHAKTILTLIEELLVEAGVELKDVQGIIVGRGPGSFTGLRVACAVVKGLALVHDIPIYPVSHLMLVTFMARKKYPHEAILSVIDARMQQVYWSYFPSNTWDAKEAVQCVSQIPSPQQSFVLAGYHFHEYQSLIPASWHIIAEMQLEIEASAMIEMFEAQLLKPVSAEQLEPVYVRDQVTQGAQNG